MITVSSVDTKDNTSEPFDQLAALQQSAGKETVYNYGGNSQS